MVSQRSDGKNGEGKRSDRGLDSRNIGRKALINAAAMSFDRNAPKR